MPKIKTKDIIKGTIKTLDKTAIATERTKEVLVNVKEKSENAYSPKESSNDYASNRVSNSTNRITTEVANGLNKSRDKSFIETKKNIIKTKNKIKNIKGKLAEKKNISKVTNKGIKTADRTVKTTKKVAKETVKATERARKLAVQTAKKTYQGVKLAVKATIATVKAIIAATKALIAAIIAGGWVAVLVIIVICLVGLLCSSIYGIFFSSEKGTGSISMNSVIKEINNEMSDKIKDIQDENDYDDYTLDVDRPEWKEVLAIYVAKVTKGSNETEVITLDDKKVKTLKEIFWDMHTVDSEMETETTDDEDEDTKDILNIKVSSKSVEEMMTKYNFNSSQKEQVKELLSEEYANMWSSAIYGVSVGSPTIVEIALSQVGNVGGQPYWSWYGYSKRVEWCAIFVSWAANEAGYIDTGIIPKFAGVQTGINWFKAVGGWKESDYVPSSGDIIFFDWEDDGLPNHVGIVEKVENNKVYTVEGNSTDDGCRQKRYSINSKVIFGYGVPAY